MDARAQPICALTDMSRSSLAISWRFAHFLERLAPSTADLAAASARARDIHAALVRTVRVARAVRVGSFFKLTAVAGTSDLDFFVVLRRDDVRWGRHYVSSTTVLSRIREALVDRYPRSAIGRDGSAVTVWFQSGIPIDVVPSVYEGPLSGGYPLYLIPDGSGDWLRTSPDAQRQSFARADNASGGKLRRSVQLVKAWAGLRDNPLPLSSTYLESVLAAAGLATGFTTYSRILAASFQLLATRGGSAIRDPIGVSGYISPANTQAKCSALARSLAYASAHADAAYRSELRENTAEAIRQWRIVLGPSFKA